MKPLSKSKLIAFRQCPKRLWLEVHRPELREDSPGTCASFQVGYQVGDIAKRLYDPAGQGAEIDVALMGYQVAFERSAELLARSRLPIFEAGFSAAGALAFADVMLPDSVGGWRMVEIKSSTSVKDYHRDDSAIQAYIAKSAGVRLSSVSLACIDNSWVYPGHADYRGLLKETDLTAEAFARAAEVEGWISKAHEVVAQPSEPIIATGDQCGTPFECGYCTYCNSAKSQPEFPLHWFPNSGALRSRMAKEGINDMRGVADDLLSAKQQTVKRATLSNAVYFDAPGAAADLASHGFPALFLDFETIQFAIPIWKGTRPYQQIPFQFSLHTLCATGKLVHTAFLDLSGHDPSEYFARSLIEACGTSGPIFVYNAGFESTRIRELAERFAILAEPLLAILPRIVDLLPVARNRYYHPSQQGSWSIKAVLPAAVPGLSYESLVGVRDGSMAMEAFVEALAPDISADRKAEIHRQLHAYCRLDTFAMVRLWQFFNGRNDPPLSDDY
jgi:hypothetical protein